jgi:hypothetical protein
MASEMKRRAIEKYKTRAPEFRGITESCVCANKKG